jgi:hypothetical protein
MIKHHRTLLFILLSSFYSSIHAAEFEHSGTIEEDTVWDNSYDHLIIGDVTVAEGVSLTISAGSRLKFAEKSDSLGSGKYDDRAELIINGSLISQGTENTPIILTSNASTATKGDWGGITGSGSLNLQHTTIEYSNVGVFFPAINKSVDITIENSQQFSI